MEFVHNFNAALLEMLRIKPSTLYFWFPNSETPETLDIMAQKIDPLTGRTFFSTLDVVIPDALKWCAVLSVLRYMCHHLFLEKFAMYAMGLEYSNRKDSKKNVWIKGKVTKFVEAAWRAMFYSVFLYLGFKAFIPDDQSLPHLVETTILGFKVNVEPMVVDTNDAWKGWPHHAVTDAMLTLYVLELGAYFHQLLWTEVKRKDAIEMILHHVVTIFLIGFSYMINMLRIGSLIIVLHDCADVFLETAKVFNYINKIGKRAWASTYCDILFGCFALVFFITRLYIYPCYIIYSIWYEAGANLNGWWGGLYPYTVFILILQVLHIYWFYLIAVMIYKLIIKGSVEKDERSDDEDEFNEEEVDEKQMVSTKTKLTPRRRQPRREVKKC
jgi:hypothetical protein